MNSAVSPNSEFSESAEDNVLPSPCWYRNSTSHHYHNVKLCDLLTRDQSIFTLCHQVIDNNKHLFRNKVILDLECGTGLVSMFLASCGAKMVIAVEEDEKLVNLTREVVRKNDIKNITVMQGDLNNYTKLAESFLKVDIIVCQWMWHLFFDNELLKKFIQVRNRWLKPNGLIFPDNIELWITAAQNPKNGKKHSSIANSTQFDLSTLSSRLRTIPNCENVSSDMVKTNDVRLHHVNLATLTKSEVEFNGSFELVANSLCEIHSFVMFFKVIFSRHHEKILISNSPFDSSSSWKQITLNLDRPINVRPYSLKIHGVLNYSLYRSLNGINTRLVITVPRDPNKGTALRCDLCMFADSPCDDCSGTRQYFYDL